MVWRRFFGRGEAPPPVAHAREEAEVAEGARTATRGGPVPRPAPSRPKPPPTDADRERRAAALRRRRAGVLFDIEQGELALAPENPWQERIDLLTESLATVAADHQVLNGLPPAPTHPVPPLPVTEIGATGGDQSEVRFRIGDQRFRFTEEIDWDNKGGMVVRGDLRPQAGDPAALVPADTPPDLRDALARHLAESIGVFAVDLRDRALVGEPLPERPTLADLAQSDPEVGGWRDWHGRSPIRAARDHRRQALRGEANRLEAERTAEAEARRTLADRLPIARRRLADIEADLTALGG